MKGHSHPSLLFRLAAQQKEEYNENKRGTPSKQTTVAGIIFVGWKHQTQNQAQPARRSRRSISVSPAKPFQTVFGIEFLRCSSKPSNETRTTLWQWWRTKRNRRLAQSLEESQLESKLYEDTPTISPRRYQKLQCKEARHVCPFSRPESATSTPIKNQCESSKSEDGSLTFSSLQTGSPQSYRLRCCRVG